jgi:SAM-dependent methyltransferase
VLLMGAVAVATFSQVRRPLRFSLMLGAMLSASALTRPAYGTVLHAERTFFGSYHVSEDAARRFRALYHGTTLHGLQALDSTRQREPLTYYHRAGPFGQAFERLARLRGASDVAVVGLGVGSLAAYASEFQQWTFYEIDPAVERIARDNRYFGFLDACGSRCRVVLGDARLSLARADARFDLIVLDAFSSDSIPMHLVTREAFELYLQRLKPGGMLMFHVSNRYLRLGDVLGRLAGDRGLAGLEQAQHVDATATADGQTDSDWVIVSADRDALASLAADARWTLLSPPQQTPLWTDDFSNILAALRFGGR